VFDLLTEKAFWEGVSKATGQNDLLIAEQMRQHFDRMMYSADDCHRLERYVHDVSHVAGTIQGGAQEYRTGGRAALLKLFNSVPRFVYDEFLGWIDLQHVAAAYVMASDYFKGAGVLGGYWVEFLQWVDGSTSAFREEDIVSNKLGDEMSSTGKLPSRLRLVNREEARRILMLKSVNDAQR
jgi:hypothetical protein